MKRILRKVLLITLALLIMIQLPLSISAAGNDLVKFYGYKQATYRIENVRTDGQANQHSPWFKNVYKYNYDYEEKVTQHHNRGNFNVTANTAGATVIWSTYANKWHITRAVSDVDTAYRDGNGNWSRYKQPKVEYRCNGNYLFTAQERSGNQYQNGEWRGNAYCDGNLEVYSHGYDGEGRNRTHFGGGNSFEYYTETVSRYEKVSDWVFSKDDIKGATSIGAMVGQGYVLPTWSNPMGWRSVTPYQKNQTTMPVEFDVYFNANGGEGTMRATSSSNYIPNNQYTRYGYTFTGWNTRSDGGGTNYANGTHINNLNPVPSGNITLYAKWQLDNYSISYDYNGGTGNNPTNFTIYSDPITLKPPTRTGYTFIGWTGSNGNTPQMEVTIPTGSAGNKSYKANWKINYYDLTLDANTGLVNGKPTEKRTIAYDHPYGTLPNPTKDGWKFTGWYTEKVGGTQVTSQTKIGAGDETIYAHWDYVAGPPNLVVRDNYYFVNQKVTKDDIRKNAIAFDFIDGNLNDRIVVEKIKYADGTIVENPEELDTSKEQVVTIYYSVTNNHGDRTEGHKDYPIVTSATSAEFDDNVQIYSRYVDDKFKDTFAPNSKWSEAEWKAYLISALNDTNVESSYTIPIK